MTTTRTSGEELDGLRLIGLGRIPICAGCPRYRDLCEAHRAGQPGRTELSPAPRACEHRYCAPLARRYGKREIDGLQRLAV